MCIELETTGAVLRVKNNNINKNAQRSYVYKILHYS